MTYFSSRDPACRTPFGALAAGEEVRFALRAGWQEGAGWLLLFADGAWEEPAAIPLQESGTLAGRLLTAQGRFLRPGLYFYCFLFTGAGRERWLCRGECGEGVLLEQRGDLWQQTVYDPAAVPPEGCGGIYYQIFPDRFASSGQYLGRLPEGGRLHRDWGELPEYRPNAEGKIDNLDYFGGDLPGIRAKLDYLAGLGVTTVYLNPIFEARSNHRYNTADYETIDPLLGDEADFASLAKDAAGRGIRLMLDGVFSHTGSDSRYFNREGHYGPGGAWRDPQSPYAGWYRIDRASGRYDCWWGFETLPNVNEEHPGYLKYLCGEQGVLAKWMALGAGGWRLDVADELPDGFLDAVWRRVKAQDPAAPVIGEVWEDASNKVSYGARRRYLQGGQLDGVMNYPLRQAMIDFARGGGAEALLETVLTQLEHYPPGALDRCMNSLSTHDSPRIMTVLGGPEGEGRSRDWQAEHYFLPAEAYAAGRAKLLPLAMVQYFLPGCPCLYYGDEAGVCGYGDPFNRTTYPWGREDKALVEFFRRLGKIRTACRPLVASCRSFVPLAARGGLLLFCRRTGQGCLTVAVNLRGEPCPLPPIAGEVLLTAGEACRQRLGGFSGLVAVSGPGCPKSAHPGQEG